jgi:hypothetical protein
VFEHQWRPDFVRFPIDGLDKVRGAPFFIVGFGLAMRSIGRRMPVVVSMNVVM